MPTATVRRQSRGLESLVIDTNGGAYVPAVYKTQTHVKRSQIEKYRSLRDLRYPIKNGYGDPLTVSLVVDLLCRLKPGQTIRTMTLIPQLRAEYPHMMWDNHTVGRILTNLRDVALDAQTANHESTPYILSDRDYLGNYFLIRNDRVAHQWLLDLLEKMAASAEQAVALAHRGEDELRAADPFIVALAAA